MSPNEMDHQSPPDQNLVNVSEAAELTGLTPKALRRRLERGTLQAVKRGGRRMIPISELERHDLLLGNNGNAAGAASAGSGRGNASTPFPSLARTQAADPAGPTPDPGVVAPAPGQPIPPPSQAPSQVPGQAPAAPTAQPGLP